MKRYITYCVLLIVTVICCVYGIWYIMYGYNYTYGTYEINIYSQCISNNSVGNEWKITYTKDNENISNCKKVIAPIDKSTTKVISVSITEIDNILENASKDIPIILNSNSSTSNTAQTNRNRK